jgi:hypothetical protein
MKQLFAWKGMKQAVRDYVTSCLTYQRTKPDHSRLLGLLQPLPVPSGAWQILSMDFVEGLPHSKHVNCILVIIDSFTKYAHFLAMSHPFTTASVTKIFQDQVYRLHGMPIAIISDRD